jgi:hypothetical protein
MVFLGYNDRLVTIRCIGILRATCVRLWRGLHSSTPRGKLRMSVPILRDIDIMVWPKAGHGVRVVYNVDLKGALL